MPEVTPPPVDPVAPSEPAAPAAPDPAPAPAEPAANEPTGPVAAPKDERTDDQKEWDEAEDELFPGIKGDKKDEPTKPEEAAKKEGESTPPSEEPKPSEEPPKPAEETPAEVPKSDPAARDARIAARAAADDLAEVRADVAKELFKDAPTELVDADGDPIRTIEDVMARINPRTGEAFTEDEASMWLLNAQQQFNKSVADREAKITQVAEVSIRVRDEADGITEEFKDILDANPELKQELWDTFEKTLIKDPDTGLIVEMPVSLDKYYRTALKPYADQAKATVAAEKKAAEDKAAAEAKAKEEEEAKRQKSRSDRSDIYANGKNDNRTTDEKEWADAEKEVLGI